MTERYNVRDLEMLQDDIGAWYYKLNGKPFTGLAFALFPQTNNLSHEGNFVNGYQEGIQKQWHKNGQLKSEENFSNNIQHGKCLTWYENGILRYECECNKGETIWSKRYNEQGELVKQFPK